MFHGTTQQVAVRSNVDGVHLYVMKLIGEVVALQLSIKIKITQLLLKKKVAQLVLFLLKNF
jgi:hypothetical protein